MPAAPLIRPIRPRDADAWLRLRCALWPDGASDHPHKNLTSFRDNLRSMLSKPSATVKDLIEIQQHLTETQSQLDSENAQRKILANQTEKIAVELSFRVEIPAASSFFHVALTFIEKS